MANQESYSSKLLFKSNRLISEKDFYHLQIFIQRTTRGLPWWLNVKNPPASSGDMSLIPDLARSHLPQSK